MSCVYKCNIHRTYFLTEDNVCPDCHEDWEEIEDDEEDHESAKELVEQ